MSFLEKFSMRLSSWKGKILLYIDIAKLIKLVCYENIMYWRSVFIFSANVVPNLNSMLSNFLWSTGLGKRITKDSWSKVTHCISSRGLRIRDIKILNTTFILKHLGNLANERHSQ